jgi:anti-anti-sigma regulatory factor
MFDMKGVTYTSSAALRETMNTGIACRTRNRGDLVVLRPPPIVEQVIERCGGLMLKQYSSEADAIFQLNWVRGRVSMRDIK